MINRVIRYLVAYDFVVNFAFGLLAPIFAVFVLQSIEGGSLRVVGISIASYWIARVTTTAPLSRLMDRTDGERDEFYFIIAGTFISSLMPIFLIFSTDAWHVYLIQFVHGLSRSMSVPGWRILFTDHIDKGKVGIEWSLEDIGVGTAVGTSAFIGAFLADAFGFIPLLVLLSGLSFSAAILIIPLSQDFKTLKELRKTRNLEDKRIHRKHTIRPTPQIGG